MRLLRVLKPGLRTTVEDLGRRRVGIWGVPRGGAFDADALAAANLLVGNDPNAAGLELTLRAPVLEAAVALDVAYVGVPFGLTIADAAGERALEPGRATRLEAGAVLRGGYAAGGARGWLAVGGGIDVPAVLGSRATELASGFGGLCGRALAAGDAVPVFDPLWSPPERARYRDPIALAEPVELRVLDGPQLGRMPDGFRAAFESGLWSVTRDSDRKGVRFEHVAGPELPAPWPREIEPEGALPGAVQLPAEGTPIVLGVDGPTTGGYAKPAVVIRADLGLVARLAPGMRARFRFVTREDARRADEERRALLAELGA